jgi:DNA-directed RNA polymerase specialized sigma24 family protein
MSPESSVSTWIASLKHSDADAAQRLWDRYSIQLVELARRRLDRVPKGFADEDDVAQSVFRNICCGAAAGRFGDIKNRDDLWWIILSITKRKTVDLKRRQMAKKRGGGQVLSESAIAGERSFSLDNLIGDDPTPELLVTLDEQVGYLLNLLRNDGLRRIAISRVEGYSVAEIADELEITTRSVERKLKLIRTTWAKCLAIADV